MSIRIMNEVWGSSKAKGSDLLVLLAIADNADEKERTAYPSIEILSWKTRLSERAVQYSINRLVKMGELSVSRGTGRGVRNTYLISTTLGKRVQKPPEKVQTVHSLKGAKIAPKDEKRVQSTTEKGADFCSPYNVLEPSVEPSEGKRPARTTDAKGQGQRQERPAMTIAREKAAAAWPDVRDALKEHMAGKRLVIRDQIARDVIQALGKDKAMTAYAREPDGFEAVFKKAYANADVDRWKREKGKG